MKRPRMYQTTLVLSRIAIVQWLVMVGGLGAAETMVMADLTVRETRVPEGLPIQFQITLRNASNLKVDVETYDVSRLPENVLKLKLDSPFLKAPPAAHVNDFGAPELELGPGEVKTLSAYVQTYLNHLSAGDYSIRYVIEWPYRANPLHKSDVGVVQATGVMRFSVSKPEQKNIDNYIDERLAIIQDSADNAAVRTAAVELSLVEDASVARVAPQVIKRGFVQEGIGIASRFNSEPSNEALRDVITPASNPVFLRRAIEILSQRGVPVRASEIRGLLLSSNPATQIRGLELINASSDPSLASVVQQLTSSASLEVQHAARTAYQQLVVRHER